MANLCFDIQVVAQNSPKVAVISKCGAITKRRDLGLSVHVGVVCIQAVTTRQILTIGVVER